MSYKFKGEQWEELAECWGIRVEQVPVANMKKHTVSEKIEVRHYIDNTAMSFLVSDEEEVLAEKVKRFLWDSICGRTGKFKNKQVRQDITDFLNALADEEDEHHCSAPVYRAIASIEGDRVMVEWVIGNLERLYV